MAIDFAITRCFDQNQALCGQDRLKWQSVLPFHAVLALRSAQRPARRTAACTPHSGVRDPCQPFSRRVHLHSEKLNVHL
ncbi:MAG: hypothetical protein QM296_09225 [Bacillota bacterium]|nr:hypothetical protein [Bacillota bacterium]